MVMRMIYGIRTYYWLHPASAEVWVVPTLHLRSLNGRHSPFKRSLTSSQQTAAIHSSALDTKSKEKDLYTQSKRRVC